MYYDLISWALLRPSFEGLKEFMKEPTWLTVEIWNRAQKERANQLQQQSIPVAKLTNCVVSAMGGGQDAKFDDFTLYSFTALDDDTIKLETILIYDQCLDKELIPSYIVGCFLKDTVFKSSIKRKAKARKK